MRFVRSALVSREEKLMIAEAENPYRGVVFRVTHCAAKNAAKISFRTNQSACMTKEGGEHPLPELTKKTDRQFQVCVYKAVSSEKNRAIARPHPDAGQLH
jgi:S-adenosylmethionine:tRNA-ribosyltransferase-isomerase (queuine synthetase)